jgi:hypothetical protein
MSRRPPVVVALTVYRAADTVGLTNRSSADQPGIAALAAADMGVAGVTCWEEGT